MSQLFQFLYLLSHHLGPWEVWVPEITRPASPTPHYVIVYGGNFFDAVNYWRWLGVGFVT